jgi:hypothetical protein
MNIRMKFDLESSVILVIIFSIISLVILVCTGCANVRVETPTWTLQSNTLFKNVELPEAVISSNGTMTIKGLKCSGDKATVEATGTAGGNLIGSAGKAFIVK